MEADWGVVAGGAKSGGFSEDDMACSKATGVWWGWSFGFESLDGFVLKRCFKTGGRPGFWNFGTLLENSIPRSKKRLQCHRQFAEWPGKAGRNALGM
jgi:hypothetical protein